MARGPQFPRRRKWADVLDQMAREKATLIGPQRTWAAPMWTAIESVRADLRRNRKDYYTPDDAALVSSRASQES